MGEISLRDFHDQTNGKASLHKNYRLKRRKGKKGENEKKSENVSSSEF